MKWHREHVVHANDFGGAQAFREGRRQSSLQLRESRSRISVGEFGLHFQDEWMRGRKLREYFEARVVIRFAGPRDHSHGVAVSRKERGMLAEYRLNAANDGRVAVMDEDNLHALRRAICGL